MSNTLTKEWVMQAPEVKTKFSKPTRLLIDGDWVEPASGKRFDDVSPVDGEVIAQVAHSIAHRLKAATVWTLDLYTQYKSAWIALK